MKKNYHYVMVLIAASIFTACNEDEKPKTVPVVATGTVTDITTESAMARGEVINDGNADITESGFVYSNTVGVPTTADEKVELMDLEGEFSGLIDGLSSGTLYHVRAFATNSIGTGYGEVVDFITGNAAPTAIDVSFTGDMEVNKLLTATYTYADAENNAENGSTFQWYMANDGTGTGVSAIAGATSKTFTIQEAQQGKYIAFGVTPKAGAGTVLGMEVKSGFVGAVVAATTVTFTYNGQSVTYGIITSGTTGKKWLDRNLGAPAVPTVPDNYQNYGDLFQWGRAADGHQVVTHAGASEANFTGVNGMTSTTAPFEFSTSDNPGHLKFIVIDGTESPFDWRKPQNHSLWQGVSGINNPCPSGWRIPTQEEWTAEGITSVADGFTKLKITFTGFRTASTGAFASAAIGGYFWSSSSAVLSGSDMNGVRIRINGTGFNAASSNRGNGFACRCIKD